MKAFILIEDENGTYRLFDVYANKLIKTDIPASSIYRLAKEDEQVMDKPLAYGDKNES